MKRNSINCRGFTLIELLMVMSIVSLVIVSVGDFLVESTNSFHMNNDRMRAYNSASEAMDIIVSTVYHTTPTVTFASDGTAISVVRTGSSPRTNVLDEEVSTLVITTITSGTVHAINRSTVDSVTINCSENHGLQIEITTTSGKYSHTIRNQAYFRNK